MGRVNWQPNKHPPTNRPTVYQPKHNIQSKATRNLQATQTVAGRSSHLTWTLPLEVTLLIPEPKVKANRSERQLPWSSAIFSHSPTNFPPRFSRHSGHCYPSSRPPLSRAPSIWFSLLVHALTTFSTPLLLVESVGDAGPPHSTSASLGRVKHFSHPQSLQFHRYLVQNNPSGIAAGQILSNR